MARAAVVPYVFSRNAGLDVSTVTPTTGDATNGHTIPNKPGLFLEVTNTNGASTSRTISFHLSGGTDGQGVVPKPTVVAPGKTIKLGPWPQDSYSGQLLVDVDNAELHFAAFQPTL